jgi:hypothetical protein
LPPKMRKVSPTNRHQYLGTDRIPFFFFLPLLNWYFPFPFFKFFSCSPFHITSPAKSHRLISPNPPKNILISTSTPEFCC